MANDFGKLLRSLRVAAGVSMGALGRHLGVSVTYLSDVERGTRAPLTQERIELAGPFLKLDKPKLLKLLEVAAEGRGFFELGVNENVSPTAKQVGATLMRGWPRYTEDDLTELAQFLQSLEDKPR